MNSTEDPNPTETNGTDEHSGTALLDSVVHIAGPDIRIGEHLRQRCAWCGTVLVDYDLTRIAVPIGQDPTPGTWPVGGLVEVDGGVSWTVAHQDGQPLPPNACDQLAGVSQ